MTGLRSAVLADPDDGSLGPLLRLADDVLAPGAGYGRHAHRAVDVVAVVLAGAVRHAWGDRAEVGAGDVAVLRAGTGLEHDEVAGDAGARVLQTYLRSADPAAAPAHRVHRAARGWVDLGRPDARLWVAALAPGERVAAPAGLLVLARAEGTTLTRQDGGPVEGPATALVWALDTGRPDWARG
ncbi:pirin family protein [Geodermatophilus sp. SYSU D00758]